MIHDAHVHHYLYVKFGLRILSKEEIAQVKVTHISRISKKDDTLRITDNVAPRSKQSYRNESPDKLR